LRIRAEDVLVGDILLGIFSVDRVVTHLRPWKHPRRPELTGRIALYTPGPTTGMTLIDGEYVDVKFRGPVPGRHVCDDGVPQSFSADNCTACNPSPLGSKKGDT